MRATLTYPFSSSRVSTLHRAAHSGISVPLLDTNRAPAGFHANCVAVLSRFFSVGPKYISSTSSAQRLSALPGRTLSDSPHAMRTSNESASAVSVASVFAPSGSTAPFFASSFRKSPNASPLRAAFTRSTGSFCAGREPPERIAFARSRASSTVTLSKRMASPMRSVTGGYFVDCHICRASTARVAPGCVRNVPL